ncbi:transmembrane glycosyltransferase [Mucilaginibacter hurinus]|uniref:Transmembrane glycosyltransferase n=1 Tax=Mucilaginibacter hurinus TaxID=2201324 RepID=A0A367GSL9_9SPHI|nr:glycosyltransferase [Mucilaginibacter hurinus]RCH56434.1 transmembrane glycosyltransferase [Mucilaginibacter hurinus]
METYIYEALFLLFQVCFISQLYYLVSNHSKLAYYKPLRDLRKVNIPISVIIAARNEEANLKANLPLILAQDYPDFEVVVVNDCSSDGSDLYLLGLQANHPQLKIVTVTEHPRFKTGKKFALTMGIKAASHEHLLFTDADCAPATHNWIARMAVNFTTKAQIVLGYSPFYKTGGLLNTFSRFETIKTAVSYLSAALKGDPYMGIGRNMAYTKTLFFSNKGFASHMHVMAGDDDLFVNQNATADNTIIEIHPDAFMFTAAKTTLRGWFRQKTRHMGVGKLYKAKHRRMLSWDAVSGFLFYILLALCVIMGIEPLLAFGLYLFRLLMQILIYSKIFKTLTAKDMLFYLPVLEPIYYIYLNVFGLIGTFIKTAQWK